jgi:hypothetical protein
MAVLAPSTRHLFRIYGDSLGMPRKSTEIPFQLTYPELLLAKIRVRRPDLAVHLYNRSKPAGTAPELAALYASDSGYFEPVDNQVVIIHCGVCDCAPRPLPPLGRRCVGKLPEPLRKGVTTMIHRHRSAILRAGCSWRNTPPARFSECLQTWFSAAARNAQAVFVLNIAPPTAGIEVHSPGFRASVNLYNQLIAAAVNAVREDGLVLVDVHRAILTQDPEVRSCIDQADGHHLTLAGHDLIADMLFANWQSRCARALVAPNS